MTVDTAAMRARCFAGCRCINCSAADELDDLREARDVELAETKRELEEMRSSKAAYAQEMLGALNEETSAHNKTIERLESAEAVIRWANLAAACACEKADCPNLAEFRKARADHFARFGGGNG